MHHYWDMLSFSRQYYRQGHITTLGKYHIGAELAQDFASLDETGQELKNIYHILPRPIAPQLASCYGSERQTSGFNQLGVR